VRFPPACSPSWLAVLSAAAALLIATSACAEVARGRGGVVSSVNPLATAAGIATLRDGGNAIDAAVAVGLTLGVVDGHNSGIGGGCFMLIRLANGSIAALDGREMAPAAATRDMFLRNGVGDTGLSQTGALASGIPGSLAVYAHALRLYGKKDLAAAILPAAEIAEKGFALDRVLAGKIKSSAELLKRFPASRAALFHEDGSPYREGETLRQPDLGASYRQIAARGAAWFYRDGFPQIAARWMAENGGIITAEDFSRYTLREREPLRTTYRGYDIVSFPPPSSGGVHVAEMLNMLERFDLPRLAPADRLHVIAESMKLAFADRAHWLGDPDFVPVPLGLIDKEYARGLSARIQLEKALPVPKHGDPPEAATRLFEKHTTHFCTADADGNWVACTATVNTAFGSKVIIPGTGIFLNNQMDDFSIQPGVPNAFRLVGGEQNAVAPGKRPLSSMSPTIVLKEGKPVLALGGAGGPTIITQTLLNLVGVLDLGLALDAALAQPRIHHQWAPDELRVERSMPAEIVASLRERGHAVQIVSGLGVSQIIGAGREPGELEAASEPRVPSSAAALPK
jgi:gamma-glutamyltranspeptidase/glutathione hydrolase